MAKLRILVIGGGGREHALAWALARSPGVEQIYVAPGNAGTTWPAAPGRAAAETVAVADSDLPGLLELARAKQIDLTVVGPEAPLAAGVVDLFQSHGLRIFGPSRAAAQLEASKVFAKTFMRAQGIPTANFALYDDYEAARQYVEKMNCPLVIKADGLAAGKGVIMCDGPAQATAALKHMLIEREFGEAGATVLIEERLSGREVSLLAFSDGKTVVPMPTARDHKRVHDGDQGPNTGGMGAYAPVPDLSPAAIEMICQSVLQPTIDGMAARGTPYVGVLYAGLMLTDAGPQLLEFNCRFGDPETQAILPLLDTPLDEVLQACISGRLNQIRVLWKLGACATVVLASPGYPGAYPKGLPINGLSDVALNVPDLMVFHAGTSGTPERPVTSGGRVLAVSATGADMGAALTRAYVGIQRIYFDGMHFRRDIGGSVVAAAQAAHPASAYSQAGVNLSTAQRAKQMIASAVRSTYGPEVLAGIGAFGGMFSAEGLKLMQQPVLVASTDGVGTKTKVAAQLGRWDTLGQDLVNHCINDILVQGARPLFMLDYIAAEKLDAEQVAAIVGGVALACRAAGCALLGGETAQMPGIYAEGEIDLAGTIVGVVERAEVIDGARVQPGDALLGLRSSGPHTNGYTLARQALASFDWQAPLPELGGTPGEALLAPHRSYLEPIAQLRAAGIDIRGLAHITGGGFAENLPRALPDGCGAVLRRGSWPEPPIFGLIQRAGAVEPAEMFDVFNMGLGMLAIVPAAQVAQALAALPDDIFHVGEIVAGPGTVTIENL